MPRDKSLIVADSQRLNGQVLAVNLQHHRRSANHRVVGPQPYNVRHRLGRRQPSIACDPKLNHADSAIIRSVLSTARKQGWKLLHTLGRDPARLMAAIASLEPPARPVSWDYQIFRGAACRRA
jgi:hypothetical protein